VVHDFRRRLAFHAQRLTSWVRSIRLECHKGTVGDRGLRATPRHAQGAERRDLLRHLVPGRRPSQVRSSELDRPAG
jgi:hypothetical protein